MKKILLMLMFSFSVIAYAAPPPDPTPVMFADQVQCFMQDQFTTIQLAPEVAFVYLGDLVMFTYQVLTIEQEAKLEFPDLVINDELLAYNDELNRPPAKIDFAELLTDKQHSNYGYPLTAN